MKKLIINADDFGFCPSVNYGILYAFQHGIVSSTSMMANMPGFDHAVSLAKQVPDLSIGVHLTMTAHKPILQTHKTMCDKQGFFDKQHKDAYDLDEIYLEFKAQIEKVKAAGIAITHLDSHHHVHTLERLRPVMERLLKEYDLPVRGGFAYDMDYDRKSILFGKFYQKNVHLSFLEEFFANMEDEQVIDMMCHPAYIEKYLQESSSYALQRMDEYDVLTSEAAKKLLVKYEIETGSYDTFL